MARGVHGAVSYGRNIVGGGGKRQLWGRKAVEGGSLC